MANEELKKLRAKRIGADIVRVNYDGAKIDYTSKQYKTIVDILSQPDRVREPRVDPLAGDVPVRAYVSSVLFVTVKKYAEKNGMSITDVVRNALCDKVCHLVE